MRVNKLVCDICGKEIATNDRRQPYDSNGVVVAVSVLIPSKQRGNAARRRRRSFDFHEECLPEFVKEMCVSQNDEEEEDDDEDFD